ncbi:MAG TPA: MBL fold metallo-hydrolase, partial [Acidimicrobiaceae bacterium]|nr:MBL fold metallo-hydrolase [Acidimicrobiaceae bacterium]
MADLSLTVLGCSGSFAAAGQACSGYLVQAADTKIWVDCGPGTLGNLQHHIALSEVDAIVVSHHHPDHCAELPVVYNAYKYFTEVARVRVIATKGVKRVTDAFQPDGDSG